MIIRARKSNLPGPDFQASIIGGDYNHLFYKIGIGATEEAAIADLLREIGWGLAGLDEETLPRCPHCGEILL